MREGTKRRGILFARILAFGFVSGGLVGALVGFVYGGGPRAALVGVLAVVVNTAIIVSAIAGGEIFLPRTRLGRALERAPLLVTAAVKLGVYGAAIAFVFVTRVGRRLAAAALLDPAAAAAALENTTPRPLMIALALSWSVTLVLLLQMTRLIGERTLVAIVHGRYHRPRAEERFFLFVDVVGSTPLAERLGPAAVHRFLGEVFRLASEPIDDHRGEVYQYVGDEIVVTWTVAEGRAAARPVACFFAIERALLEAAPAMEREFGAAPRLRAALHAGPVITGEVGGTRRALVHHGDVLNTASRIEQATRDLGRPFLVSGDALERLAGLEGFALEDLGPQRLRGRAAALHVYAVTAKRG